MGSEDEQPGAVRPTTNKRVWQALSEILKDSTDNDLDPQKWSQRSQHHFCGHGEQKKQTRDRPISRAFKR